MEPKHTPLKKWFTTRKHSPKHAIKKARLSRNPLVLAGVAVMGLVVIAFSIALSIQALNVKNQLEAVQEYTGTIKQQIEQQDFAGLKESLEKVSVHTQSAAEDSGSFVWRTAEFIPFAGPNLTAVREVSQQSNNIISKLVLPAVDIIPLDGALPKNEDGTINLAIIDDLTPLASSAQQLVGEAQQKLQAAESPFLIPQIASPLEQIIGIVDQVAPAAEKAPEYVAVARYLLGMDHPITLALVAMNNAELAALGGNSEQISLMTIDKGKVSIERQISNRDISLDPVEPPFDPEIIPIYDLAILRWANAATYRPDFPTAAELLNRQLGKIDVKPDAYIALDPIALSNVLHATGPVTLQTGDVLTSENAVSLLLNEVYLRYSDDISGRTDIFLNLLQRKFFRLYPQGISKLLICSSR